MHAFAAEAFGGALGNFLPVEWASFVASPVYGEEFQRGVAAGGYVPGDFVVAVEGAFQAGERAFGAGCAAEDGEKAGVGDGGVEHFNAETQRRGVGHRVVKFGPSGSSALTVFRLYLFSGGARRALAWSNRLSA